MTRLRVLSGRHAGVSIDWISPRLVVGANEDLDVFIGDWNAQQIELRHDAEGRPQARWLADADNVGVQGEQRVGADLVCTLEPWVPVRFGAVILCIGPADGEWPDDAELLRRCFAPPPPAEAVGPAAARKRPPVRRRVMIAAAACCTIAAAPSAMQRSTPAPVAAAPVAAAWVAAPASAVAPVAPAASAAVAAAPAVPASAARSAPSRADALARLQRIVSTPAVGGLAVEHGGERVIVRGVLPSRTAVDQLNRQLDALTVDLPLSRRFVAAQDIVDRLYESMPDNGLSVRHLEHHRFEVTGRVADPARAGAAIRQVAADLAEFGAEIGTALQPLHDALPPMSGLLIDSQGTSFLRTRDGVKHIVVAGAPRGGPAPSTGSTRSNPTEPNRAHGAGAAP
jgi:type III secretion protein D